MNTLTQDRQMEKDLLAYDITSTLKRAKENFTDIYLAEIIVEGLGDYAPYVWKEMEYFVNEMKEAMELEVKVDQFLNYAVKEGMIGAEEASEMTKEEKLAYYERAEFENKPGEKDTNDWREL